ncbi:MAG: FadR family transcriptional regulator, partial [Deltaproteobacteria bacterium]|nr:FadR family transcriptional regulator [Deltaproteobacteria bacterium]
MTPAPPRRHSIADGITEHLLSEILRDGFRAGDRLPPERELAVRFGTNRNTLREALRNLATMNLISARQGDGLHVLDFRETGELHLLPLFLRFEGGTVEERIQLLEDVLRMRRLLIVEVVRGLALQGSGEDVRAIRTLVEEQRGHQGDLHAMVETDLEILLAMVKASRSLAIMWVFNTVVRLYREIVFVHPGLWYFAEDYCDRLDQVLEACSARDPARA